MVVQGKGGTTTGQGTLWRSHPGGVPENNVGITPGLRNLFLHEPLAALAMRLGGGDEPAEQRVRLVRLAVEFRVELAGDEKRVL